MRCSAPASRRRFQVQDFGTPESLLVAPEVSLEDKRRLLEQWSRDLTGRHGAAPGSRSANLLRRVRSAIELLDSPAVIAVRRPMRGAEESHGTRTGRR